MSENICRDIPVDNKELNELIKRLEKIRLKDPNIQLFLSKTFYFNIGYGEMIKCKDIGKMSLFFPQNYESIQATKVSEIVNSTSEEIVRNSSSGKLMIHIVKSEIIYSKLICQDHSTCTYCIKFHLSHTYVIPEKPTEPTVCFIIIGTLT